MHFFAYTPQRERLIVLLWGLLFAKCFILEHYVRAHEIPVNSWLYVWALSISMATVATLAFWRMRSAEGTPLQIPRALLAIWSLCLLAGALVWLSAVFLLPAAVAWMVAGFAVLLGLGYTFQSLQTRSLLDWVPAIGWWLTAAFLVLLPADQRFFAFGWGLLLWVVSPLAVKISMEWFQARAAVRALEHPHAG